MRVCQVLMLFLVLWDGRPYLTRAETFSAAEGENFTLKFLFYSSGKWKIFCKNDCNKTEDILVKTSDNRHQNGRYSINYDKYSSNPCKMSVSITNVSRSDSGRYRCGLENWSGSIKADKDYIDFMIEVTNDLTPRPAVSTLFYVTPKQQRVTSSPPKHQLNLTTSLSGALLYMGLTMAAAVILLSVILFILSRKKRANKPQGRPGASENAQIPESNCLYDEVPDELSQSRPRPVEISTVYASAVF